MDRSSPPLKTTVIYHSADFDGIFCREIARKFLGDENVTYIGWNHGDKPVELPSEGTIYVMDLPVDRVFGFDFGDPETIPPAFSASGDLPDIIWIDHHKTAIETHPPGIPGYRISGVAACRLAWQWFAACEEHMQDTRFLGYPQKQDFIARKVIEPLAVRLAGEYDIWDKRDPDAEVFQFGLKSVEVGDAQWPLLLDTREQFTRDVVHAGFPTKRYQRAQDKERMARSFEVQWAGLTFLTYNGRGNSLTFLSAIKPQHDALLLCHWDGRKWMVSLYHAPGKEHHDLSEIAKRNGGGGHGGACGFVCEKLPFLASGE